MFGGRIQRTRSAVLAGFNPQFSEVWVGDALTQSGGNVTTWPGEKMGLTWTPDQGAVKYAPAAGNRVPGAFLDLTGLTDGVSLMPRLALTGTINAAAPQGRTFVFVYDAVRNYQGAAGDRMYLWTSALSAVIEDRDLTNLSHIDSPDVPSGPNYRPAFNTAANADGSGPPFVDSPHRSYHAIDANHQPPLAQRGMNVMVIVYTATRRTLFVNGVKVGEALHNPPGTIEVNVMRSIDGFTVLGSSNGTQPTNMNTRFWGTYYMVGVREQAISDADALKLSDWCVARTGVDVPFYGVRTPEGGIITNEVYRRGHAVPLSGALTSLNTVPSGPYSPDPAPTNTNGVPTFAASSRVTASNQAGIRIAVDQYDVALVINPTTIGSSLHIWGTNGSSACLFRILDVGAGVKRVRIFHGASTADFPQAPGVIGTGLQVVFIRFLGGVLECKVGSGPWQSVSSFPNISAVTAAVTVGASSNAGANQFTGTIEGWHFSKTRLNPVAEAERIAWLAAEHPSAAM